MTRALATCMLLCAAACASKLPSTPPNVSNAMEPYPTPRVAANDAKPEILAMSFNSLDVRRGTVWSGKFVTTTNVASVEVRTNLFSIDVPRTAFGKFAFSVDLLDVPPIFVRAYRLRVLARNSQGVIAEEDLPFHIR